MAHRTKGHTLGLIMACSCKSASFGMSYDGAAGSAASAGAGATSGCW